MGHIEAISSVTRKHGWGIFFLHLDDVLPRSSVLFDEDAINAQYGLSESPDEHAGFVKTMSLERLAQVLIDVCVEVMQWSISRNDCYTINISPLDFSILSTHITS
ncbi:hypothetical protein PVK06_030385 [Gossypium arboreum]|uniref:Uncharacterized protein n=1 Tax=Gossypium arboreum TaxID=29729 RepID=A0ABR0NN58_GOSAR|nr:hypothetical protein PVK06_030385 [Gossypium arboreum]